VLILGIGDFEAVDHERISQGEVANEICFLDATVSGLKVGDLVGTKETHSFFSE
jgi:hypothetical protein